MKFLLSSSLHYNVRLLSRPTVHCTDPTTIDSSCRVELDKVLWAGLYCPQPTLFWWWKATQYFNAFALNKYNIFCYLKLAWFDIYVPKINLLVKSLSTELKICNSRTCFCPSYCQISTDLDKILHTPIVVLLYWIHLWADFNRDRRMGGSRPNQNDYVFSVIVTYAVIKMMDRRDFGGKTVRRK